MVVFGLKDSNYFRDDRFEGYDGFKGFEGFLLVEIQFSGFLLYRVTKVQS